MQCVGKAMCRFAISKVSATAKPELVFEDVDIHEVQEALHLKASESDELEVMQIGTLQEIQARMLFQKRRTKSLEKEQELLNFLAHYDFSDDVNMPRVVKNGCFLSKPQKVYPVHMAAAAGDHKILRLLLRAGADPKQKTSKGADALEIAQYANRRGSHDQVVALLTTEVKLLSAREALNLKATMPRHPLVHSEVDSRKVWVGSSSSSSCSCTGVKEKLPLSRDRRIEML